MCCDLRYSPKKITVASDFTMFFYMQAAFINDFAHVGTCGQTIDR